MSTGYFVAHFVLQFLIAAALPSASPATEHIFSQAAISFADFWVAFSGDLLAAAATALRVLQPMTEVRPTAATMIKARATVCNDVPTSGDSDEAATAPFTHR